MADNQDLLARSQSPDPYQAEDIQSNQAYNANQAKYGGFGDQVGAFLEGGARGATLGLSDLGLVGSGIETPESLHGKSQAGPWGDIGNVLGGAALIGATGGLGGLAEGAGVGAKIAATAAEGGLFGAGQAVSDYAMGDPDLNAQKVMSYIGAGAALGAGFSTLGAAVSEYAPKATQKLSSALGKIRDFAVGTEETPGAISNIAPKWGEELRTGVYGGNIDSNVRKLSKNLTDLISSGKEIESTIGKETLDSELGPALIGAHKEYLDALNGTEEAPGFKEFFMNKGSVDPAKVKSYFENMSGAESDLQTNAFNNLIDQSQKLAKASEAHSGFEAGTESISDHVTKLAKQNANLQNIAEAMSKGSKSSLFKEGMVGSALHFVGIPEPIVGTGIAMHQLYNQLKAPYMLGQNLQTGFSVLKAVGDILEKVNDKIGRGAKAIFSNNATRGGIGATAGLLAGYDKKVGRIQELSNDISEMSNHMVASTDKIHPYIPNITQGLHNSMVSSVGFLNSKIPRPATQLPLSQKWEPTESQKATFGRYYQSVDDPISALKQIKDGSLSNETMEALHAVHPKLLSEMQQKVMENMVPGKGQKLNYATKIALTKFLGQPLEEGMLPQAITSNQMVYQSAPQSMPQKPKRGGEKKMTLANLSKTETQRDEV